MQFDSISFCWFIPFAYLFITFLIGGFDIAKCIVFKHNLLLDFVFFYDFDIWFWNCSNIVVFWNYSNIVVFWNCSNSVVFWNCSNSVVFWNCSNSVVFWNYSNSVVFWNCSNSVVFFVLFFILLLMIFNISVCKLHFCSGVHLRHVQ